MILGIVGCRDFHDYDRFCQYMQCVDTHDITRIVSGGASGADALAERYAREHNIPLTIHYADWTRYGRSAGPRRNRLIVQDSDRIVAFWDYQSRGTASTISIAKETGCPVSIFRI